MLVVLLNKMWEDEALPDELAVCRIVTLFKGGDVHECGDYRGISLLNVVYKLLSAIQNMRLVRYCDENGVLDEEQGGFRQGRGCTDQIYSLHTVVAERKGRGVDSYMCFIDVKYSRANDGYWIDEDSKRDYHEWMRVFNLFNHARIINEIFLLI